jgi:hypothetical protein
MVRGRGGYHAIVEAHIEELLKVADDWLSLDVVGYGRGRVVDALKVNALKFVEYTAVVAAHYSKAEYACT